MGGKIGFIFLFAILFQVPLEIEAKVCTPEQIQPCPLGWIETSSPRLCLKHWPTLMTYTKARDHCRERRSNLVVAYNAELKRQTKDFMLRSTFRYYWLSFNDRAKEGSWRWEEARHHRYVSVKYWDTGHPSSSQERGESHDCAVMDNEKFKWKESSCDSDHEFICEFKSTNGNCPRDWHRLRKNNGEVQCLKVNSYETTWAAATRSCASGDPSRRHLLSIEDADKYNKLKEYMKEEHRFWLGLTDIINEMKWIWTFGHVPEYYSWGPGEAKDTRAENCAMAAPHGRWYDASCDATIHEVLCQRESFSGPRDVRITTHYHLAPNVAYNGGILDIICTALNAEGGKMEWVAHTTQPYSATFHNAVEAVTTADGACVNQTISTCSVKVTATTRNLIFSCFPYKLIDKNKRCVKPEAKYSFCAISASIKVVNDGPLTQPILTVDYKGKPEALEPHAVVKATCTFSTRRTGKLFWAVYKKDQAPEVFTQGDQKVTRFQSQSAGNQILMASDIELQATSTGLSVACFAYDFRSQNRSAQCQVWDRYCVRKDLRVPKNKWSALSGSLLFVAFSVALMLLILLFVVAYKYFTGTHPRQAAAAYDSDDDDDDDDDDDSD